MKTKKLNWPESVPWFTSVLQYLDLVVQWPDWFQEILDAACSELYGERGAYWYSYSPRQVNRALTELGYTEEY